MYTNQRNYDELIEQINKLFGTKNSSTIVLIDIDLFHKTNTHWDNNKKILEYYHFLKGVTTANILYLGKDEFGLVYPIGDLNEVMIEIISAKINFHNNFNTTLSAGIAAYPKQGEDYVEIIRNLEDSLYQAKLDGRDKILIADNKKLKLKSNYYTPIQLSRLNKLSEKLQRSEASLLREALDEIFRKYES
ncbi:diguanylate cyclase [Bacillus infantis]|uniref:Diguanylate cyclase n=1 Tax=Bacillus infantis TaxID=324767 RepID=A0A5D4SD11_9BACI|nr:diguanylate cyclase [Bacillus infantis]TYS60551.1 diguanylate cyclase [Bacillus infantis]